MYIFLFVLLLENVIMYYYFNLFYDNFDAFCKTYLAASSK